jgi:hypothetical protein
MLTVASTGTAAGGSIPGVTLCKSFVSAKWQNPYPPHEIGDHFQAQVSGKAFTCATADAYIKKFIVQKIKPEKTMPQIGLVAGGPKGYTCSSGISYTHQAYQGSCKLAHATPTSSWFSWGPYNDS